MLYEPDRVTVYRRVLELLGQHDERAPFKHPTCTEDGIPIRKLYITRLPVNTTRYELMECFRKYGWIKSCWVKLEDNRIKESSFYAFVTFVNPEDAHRALSAPIYEKRIRGRVVRVAPADSWHQPSVDGKGQVLWGHKKRLPEPSASDEPEPSTSSEGYEDLSRDPVAVLNRDCLLHVFSFMEIYELVPLTRVNKRWQYAVHDYFSGVRVFRSSTWRHKSILFTTAVLRNLLQYIGASLTKLHFDHDHLNVGLNERTARVIAKYCPNLEELTLYHLNPKTWDPIIYGCKKLKDITFTSCMKLTDRALLPLMNHPTSALESLSVIGNHNLTGEFIGALGNPGASTTLKRLKLHLCHNLRSRVLLPNVRLLTQLTSLHVDTSEAIWLMIPELLTQLPQLVELSIVGFCTPSHLTPKLSSRDTKHNRNVVDALATLTELKVLNLANNMFVSDQMLKQIGRSCPKLVSIDLAACNGLSQFASNTYGITDNGLISLIKGCKRLETIDVSFLYNVTDKGILKLTTCKELRNITARGSDSYSTEAFSTILRACRHLSKLNLFRCDSITVDLVIVACEVLDQQPRKLSLILGGTPASTECQYLPTHKLLSVQMINDASDMNREKYIEHLLEFNSDDSDDPFDLDELMDNDFDELPLPNLRFLNESFDGANDDLSDDEFEVVADLANLPIPIFHRGFYIV